MGSTSGKAREAYSHSSIKADDNLSKLFNRAELESVDAPKQLTKQKLRNMPLMFLPDDFANETDIEKTGKFSNFGFKETEN